MTTQLELKTSHDYKFYSVVTLATPQHEWQTVGKTTTRTNGAIARARQLHPRGIGIGDITKATT